MTARAVRQHAESVLAAAEAGQLENWTLDLKALAGCADLVAAVVRKRYPTLDVPFHARWRHFVFGGRDLWRDIAADAHWRDRDAKARACFDLAITSVLLDAGAGGAWRFEDTATDITATRSEGLALASLRLFEWGGFSVDPTDPLRADAEGLARLDEASLADAFQVSAGNPLEGLGGRARLLNRLGQTVDAHPELFAINDDPRPGGLYDALKARRSADGTLPAPIILETLLEALNPIWENRPTFEGEPLGDCWLHSGFGFVPLHKLSQWLAYSLIEPLQEAAIPILNIDGLTGLAEYRNGGLFIDTGVLTLNGSTQHMFNVHDLAIIEWRSLTVALLDRIAPLVRARLGVTDAQFPLACVLEGGTWAAGREIARQKRPATGGPPLLIHSDGTVF